MIERYGFRGYIGSRALATGRVPQHIQNTVIRSYAQRQDLAYLLSAVEYTMPGCYMMLENLLDDLPHVQGLICYSLFMLPDNEVSRRRVYDRIIDADASLHTAVEEYVIAGEDDIARVEDVWLVHKYSIGA